MGKGGRFGKYGEHKRFQRLRQGKSRAIKATKILGERKTPLDLLRRKGQGDSRHNKAGPIEESHEE